MAVSYKDYYKLLGVDRSADKDTIARAYKKLAKKYHPDLNPGDKSAEEMFKEVNEAYEVLKDPKKRQLYDQLGPNWQQGQQFGGFDGFGGFGGFGGQGFDGRNMHFTFNGRDMGDMGGMGGSGFSDFFESLFGQGSGFGGAGAYSRAPRRGSDINVNVELTLAQVQEGGRHPIALNLDGERKTYEVNIPKGIADGAKLRLAGRGRPGPAGPGDLLVTIRYREDPNFKVGEDGRTLQCDVPVAPWEAALGGVIEVPTLEGRVQINLPGNSNSGRGFRLRGKGLGPEGRRGDLIARIQVQMPQTSSAEEVELWKKLASCSSFRPRQGR